MTTVNTQVFSLLDGLEDILEDPQDWTSGHGEGIDVSYFFELGQDSGVLEYITDIDLVEPGDEVLERLATRVRWEPPRTGGARGGAGRADFVLTGGSLAVEALPGSECWDEELHRTWWLLDLAPVEEEGASGDCVFPERAEVEELPD